MWVSCSPSSSHSSVYVYIVPLVHTPRAHDDIIVFHALLTHTCIVSFVHSNTKGNVRYYIYCINHIVIIIIIILDTNSPSFSLPYPLPSSLSLPSSSVPPHPSILTFPPLSLSPASPGGYSVTQLAEDQRGPNPCQTQTGVGGFGSDTQTRSTAGCLAAAEIING